MLQFPHDVLIAPSILSADFGELGVEIWALEEAGADVVHVDVMDGHFVPNLTIGPLIVRAIKPHTALPLDTHLMMSNPQDYVTAFAEAGSDWISVHAEACPHLHRVVGQIRDAGAKPGVVLNPHTPPEVVRYVLADLHHVLLMSVNPGFGGQRFIPSVVPKARQLKAWIDEAGLDVRIQIDGGINRETIEAAAAAGVDTFVAGSAVFGSNDYAAAIAELRKLAQSAQSGALV